MYLKSTLSHIAHTAWMLNKGWRLRCSLSRIHRTGRNEYRMITRAYPKYMTSRAEVVQNPQTSQFTISTAGPCIPNPPFTFSRKVFSLSATEFLNICAIFSKKNSSKRVARKGRADFSTLTTHDSSISHSSAMFTPGFLITSAFFFVSNLV